VTLEDLEFDLNCPADRRTWNADRVARRVLEALRCGLEQPHATVTWGGLADRLLADDCPDHGPLTDGRCYQCEHIDLLIDTAIEQR